ncbi:MAG: prephenate dehydratase [Gemmatimonadota bacterium]
MAAKPRPSGAPAVAIQGCAGSFSHEAAERLCGAGIRIVECDSFAATLDALVDGRVARIVLPVENTVLGPLPTVRELLSGAPVRETGGLDLPVRHCLVVPGAAAIRIRRVASHPVALAQCRRFLRARPDWSALSTEDTAGAVRDLAAGRLPVDAAIASARAARLYGCRVLRSGIQDDPRNVTRFVVLERESATAPEPDRRISRTALAAGRPPDRRGPDPCSPSAPPR